jgi:hypothetical protein
MLDIAALAINVGDSPFKSDVAQREHIWLPEDHNTKHRDRPRTDTLDIAENMFPSASLAHCIKNFL